MTRIEAILKMRGAAENATPLKYENELIYPWDINLNLSEFADDQIKEFYDLEVKNAKRTTK